MVAWIVVVSFVLHGVALWFIVLLYTRLSQLKEVEQSQSAMMKEMEEVVSSYLVEMKEQNDEFIRRFERIKEKTDKKWEIEEKAKEDRTAFEVTSKPSEEDFRELLGEKAVDVHKKAKQQEEGLQMPEMPYTEDLTPQQIKKIALSLQKKGLTIEEIAKYLHRGKTEIELLLLFNKNL